MLLFLKQIFPPSPYLIPGSIYFKFFLSIYSLRFGGGKTWVIFIPAVQYLSDLGQVTLPVFLYISWDTTLHSRVI